LDIPKKPAQGMESKSTRGCTRAQKKIEPKDKVDDTRQKNKDHSEKQTLTNNAIIIENIETSHGRGMRTRVAKNLDQKLSNASKSANQSKDVSKKTKTTKKVKGKSKKDDKNMNGGKTNPDSKASKNDINETKKSIILDSKTRISDEKKSSRITKQIDSKSKKSVEGINKNKRNDKRKAETDLDEVDVCVVVDDENTVNNSSKVTKKQIKKPAEKKPKITKINEVAVTKKSIVDENNNVHYPALCDFDKKTNFGKDCKICKKTRPVVDDAASSEGKDSSEDEDIQLIELD
jgi:hypothetical protein